MATITSRSTMTSSARVCIATAQLLEAGADPHIDYAAPHIVGVDVEVDGRVGVGGRRHLVQDVADPERQVDVGLVESIAALEVVIGDRLGLVVLYRVHDVGGLADEAGSPKQRRCALA